LPSAGEDRLLLGVPGEPRGTHVVADRLRG
jgi:hypothetical protein